MEATRNTWILLKRELKSYFESPVAYVFLIFALVLIGFLTFLSRNGSGYYEDGVADLRQPFFSWFPVIYLILCPAISMRLWAEERRAGTMELLLTLPITPLQAVLGKFLAAWLFAGTALALTLPIVATTAWLGDPDLGVVATCYAGCFMTAGVFLSAGSLVSAMTRNQVIAFVLAFGLCFILTLAGFSTFTGMLSKWAPQWLVDGVAAFGIMPHFISTMRGVIDLRDFTYYLTAIVVMLAGTHIVIESKKGS